MAFSSRRHASTVALDGEMLPSGLASCCVVEIFDGESLSQRRRWGRGLELATSVCTLGSRDMVCGGREPRGGGLPNQYICDDDPEPSSEASRSCIWDMLLLLLAFGSYGEYVRVGRPCPDYLRYRVSHRVFFTAIRS